MGKEMRLASSHVRGSNDCIFRCSERCFLKGGHSILPRCPPYFCAAAGMSEHLFDVSDTNRCQVSSRTALAPFARTLPSTTPATSPAKVRRRRQGTEFAAALATGGAIPRARFEHSRYEECSSESMKQPLAAV